MDVVAAAMVVREPPATQPYYRTMSPLKALCSARVRRRSYDHAERVEATTGQGARSTDRTSLHTLEAIFFLASPFVKIWTSRDAPPHRVAQCSPGPGSGPCSASKPALTRANTSSARSIVAESWVAITLVRSSAPPGGTAGCSAVFTNTPSS